MKGLIRSIFRFYSSAPTCRNLSFTNWAAVRNKTFVAADRVQDRLFAVLVAFCTYQMRWLAICHSFLQRIGNSSSFPLVCQFISLLLAFPCFYACDFFFKFAYLLNHSRLLRIGRKCAALGGQNGALKLNDFSLDISQRFKLKEALCDVSRELETGNRSLNHMQINHKPSSISLVV